MAATAKIEHRSTFCRPSLTEHFSKQKIFSIYNSFQNISQQVQRLRPNGDLFRAFDPEEGRSPAFSHVNSDIDQHYMFYQSANRQQNRTTGVGVMALKMSVFTYSCIFGYYLEIYRR
jgi:hypothetical protein